MYERSAASASSNNVPAQQLPGSMSAKNERACEFDISVADKRSVAPHRHPPSEHCYCRLGDKSGHVHGQRTLVNRIDDWCGKVAFVYGKLAIDSRLIGG